MSENSNSIWAAALLSKERRMINSNKQKSSNIQI